MRRSAEYVTDPLAAFGPARSRYWHTDAVASCALLIATCAQAGPTGPVPLTEEALQRGIDYSVTPNPLFGYGVTFADLDGDDDPDIVMVGRSDGVAGVFENDGTGHFTDHTDVTATARIGDAGAATGCAWADFDGWLDLYVANRTAMFSERPNCLYRNSGDGTFADMAAKHGADAAVTLADFAQWQPRLGGTP